MIAKKHAIHLYLPLLPTIVQGIAAQPLTINPDVNYKILDGQIYIGCGECTNGSQLGGNGYNKDANGRYQNWILNQDEEAIARSTESGLTTFRIMQTPPTNCSDEILCVTRSNINEAPTLSPCGGPNTDKQYFSLFPIVVTNAHKPPYMTAMQ